VQQGATVDPQGIDQPHVGRLGRSRLGAFKPLADFDWAWPKLIDREPSTP
jgi:hypothetical protein